MILYTGDIFMQKKSEATFKWLLLINCRKQNVEIILKNVLEIIYFD